MKLPLPLILHSIEKALPDHYKEPPFLSNTVFSPSEEENILCPRPSIVQKGEDIHGLLVYDGDAIDIGESLTQNDILICEKNSIASRSSKYKVITIKEGFHIPWILNRIHVLFNKWEQWNSTIMELTIKKAPLREFLQISEKYFEKPLALMDRNFYIPGISNIKSLSFLNHSPFINESYNSFSLEQVNIFKNDPSFLAAEKYRYPFYWPIGTTSPIPLICSNIVYNNVYCARLLLYENDNRFHSWDFYFLNILSQYITSVYISQKEISFEPGRTEMQLLKLLQGEPLNNKEMAELLREKQWHANDQYRITILQLSREDISNQTMRYFCKEIEYRFPSLLSCEKSRDIIILENLTAATHPQNSKQNFSEFIREANFRAGSSASFTGLETLPSYIEEARIALHYGFKSKTMTWHQKFSDYAFFYFIDKGTEDISAERICAEEIRILQEYDRINKTELCPTLERYLRNKQNASQTAKELFIQRGTLLYRLTRMEQLAGIDFNNHEQILYITLSFHMLHMKND